MSQKITLISHSTRRTKQIGKALAKLILLSKKADNKAILIGLKGELGGGKTTLIQGMAQGLGIETKILSPTFVIMKNFAVSPRKRFYHLDVYRISKSAQMKTLQFKDIINNPNNIVMIEWANLIKDIMPNNTIWIEFKVKNISTRNIKMFIPDWLKDKSLWTKTLRQNVY